MLGMGPIEILVVLLLAFILLGPQQMLDAARLLGKATREMRRITEDFPKIVLDEELSKPKEMPRDDTNAAPAPRADDTEGSPGEDKMAEREGPVSFKPASTGSRPDDGEPPVSPDDVSLKR